MDRVLVVFPTHWDERHLVGPGRVGAGRYDVVLAEPSDVDCPEDLDVLAWIDATVARERGRLAGVTSSSDYPGATVAAAIATALGLPGSHPDAVMRASHKYHSRRIQREAAPEATPSFALVDPRRPDGGPPRIDFPCFVKPVKGAFSVLARRIEDPAALARFLDQPDVRAFLVDYMRVFNRLASRYGSFEVDGSWFLAEGLLPGDLVTVEGFVHGGAVEVLGVVDSVVDPATRSFVRFDYPSRLAPAVRQRMEDVARRVVAAQGLESTLWNIEMVHDPARDSVHVIEVNPRMCGQFADLYAKVDGVHGYEVALDLAVGRRPRLTRGAGPCAVAASRPLRVFEPVRVAAAPSPADVARVEAAHPGALVWVECAPGDALGGFAGGSPGASHEGESGEGASAEDGASVRYAVLNAGAADWAALDAELAALERELGFELVTDGP